VDAERAPTTDPQAPVAGLTVLDFRDNHLAYAITWFALAAMVAAAAVASVQFERRRVTPG
jgi:surfeit locus 1 family protein